MPPKVLKGRNSPAGAMTKRTRRAQSDATVEVYNEMIMHAVASPTSLREEGRALKRRKTGNGVVSGNFSTTRESSPYDEGGTQYGRGRPQTVHDDSESSEASDADWEQVDLKAELGSEVQLSTNDTVIKDISVVLDGAKLPQTNTKSSRRLPTSAVEKQKRLGIHKMHLCCLISHVYVRNSWCNDENIQMILRPLLGQRTLSYLDPDPSNPQFARSRSFADGLKQASDAWRAKFRITARGLRKPTWTLGLDSAIPSLVPADFDPSLRKVDFANLAGKCEGSRDAGAQMFCALLRSAGVEARLVCSLQALPFAAVLQPRLLENIKPTAVHDVTDSDNHPETGDEDIVTSPSRPASVNGHTTPLATPTRIKRFYRPAPSVDLGKSPSTPAVKRRRIKESPYPIYWIEAFNTAIQKWLPVDPLVTMTVAKASKLEPPTSDSFNNMTYVVAFDEDGSVKDVTRRYAKAYNAKTRKSRVEATAGGERWWKKALKIFYRGCESAQDQVEDAELAHKEASEPMPRNVQDFKDHPYYALERHLRRNEVIHPKREVGKLSTGKASEAVEPIYRRRDVQLVKTADKWYRTGREIKPGEVPLKHAVKARHKARSPSTGPATSDGDEDDQGRALYADFQTSLYAPPPVVQGRVPRNAFGNLDVYVPSMIPPGGVHIRVTDASRAARIIGVDFADAVTGFEFRGRHGTAVTKGIIVAKEYREAVEEVVKGLSYQRELAEEEKRGSYALQMWKRFLTGLKIRERVMGYGEGVDDVKSLSMRIDEIEEQEAEEAGDGGFFPGADQVQTTKRAAAQERNGVVAEDADLTMRGLATSEDGINDFSEHESKYHMSSYMETTIPSPWDRPGALTKFRPPSNQSRNDDPQSEPLSRASNIYSVDTGGGFMQEEGDGPRLPPHTTEEMGGFVHEEQPEPNPTFPGPYPSDHVEMADLITVEGDQNIGEGEATKTRGSPTDQDLDRTGAPPNGPVTADLDVQASSAYSTMHQQRIPPQDGAPTSPQLRKPPHQPLRSGAEAVGDDSVAQTRSETDDEEEERGREGSMLSHDPEDDEAEPEWLVDEAAL